MSPVGLARFCTLRSWLSQWSYDHANGDAVTAGPDIAVPALVQRETLREAVGICTDWLRPPHGFSSEGRGRAPSQAGE